MASKRRVIIGRRYSGKNEDKELVFELIRSIRLPKGQISVIVQSDLSISIVANKDLTIDEIEEIIKDQYFLIQEEIERVEKKRIGS